MNKLLFPVFLFVAVFPIRSQTPPPSFPSAGDALPTPSTAPATKVDPAKEQLIRQVLAYTKEPEKAQERILSAMEAMKLNMPRVGEKYWEKYRSLISIEELRDRLVYVYDRHYTSEELNELLKFYESPVGKKVSDQAVPILRESMDIAQDLSKRAARSVTADYQAEQLLQRPRAAGSLGSPILAPPSRNPAESATPSPTATPTAP